jgi:putative membrane protein
MHLIWWILWIMLLIWIFATPWDIPGQKTRKESTLDVLKNLLAKGEIDLQEYEKRKQVIEND